METPPEPAMHPDESETAQHADSPAIPVQTAEGEGTTGSQASVAPVSLPMEALIRQMFDLQTSVPSTDMEEVNDRIEMVPDYDLSPGAPTEIEPFTYYRPPAAATRYSSLPLFNYMLPQAAVRSSSSRLCPIPSTSSADDRPNEALLQSDLSNQPARVYPSPPTLPVDATAYFYSLWESQAIIKFTLRPFRL